MAKQVHSLVFKTNRQKLISGIWPYNYGIRARFPHHYKLRYVKNCMEEFHNPDAVHWEKDPRKYKLDEWGQRVRVQNVPIPLYFPKEADRGLWGGEGIIKCFKKREKNKWAPFVPKIYVPLLFNRIFYSEILDKWMDITVTRTTLNKIDDAFGFDNYILKTADCHLKSKLGANLKREMLLTLARQSLYPNDSEKREKVLKKYGKFIIPEEEAEWVGLSLVEAEDKQRAIEEAQRKAEERPLKQIYAEQLLHKLDKELGAEKEEQRSWLSRLNPFQTKSKETEV